ncbi:MAG: outer membrane lipoprotein-sorting protein [Deltaproteobacteria bacterium]|nr:outer membrane lipoprotein-sorting protein [Deltaproteobacteria bacterium]
MRAVTLTTRPIATAACVIHVTAVMVLLGVAGANTAGAQATARAAPTVPATTPTPAIPADSSRAKTEADLTGKEIFDRVVENRFESMIQIAGLISGNRADRTFATQFQVYWKNYEDVPNRDKAESKTLIRYLDPFDMRHTSYLAVSKEGGREDHWVYLPSRGQIRRINLRGDSIYGTDFSFEDVVPPETEDSEYKRLADDPLDGIDCFVVEVYPKPEARSEYSKMVVWVDKARNLPIKTRYWNLFDLEVKEFLADPSTIEKIEGIWVAHRSTMRHLRRGTFTHMVLEEVRPNANLTERHFDLRRLESGIDPAG